MFYVYHLIDPRNNLVFYVGKGKNNRMFKHEKCVKLGKMPNGNKKLFDKITEIISLNLNIKYEKVFETENEKEAYEYENYLINNFGIENLCNVVNDKLLIGMCSNTKNSNWYYNQITKEYKLFKKEDLIPESFIKGSPKTQVAMEKWWNNLTEDELKTYKNKMSNSLKNSEKHKLKVKTEEYKINLSNGLLNSEKFKEYNERRKGSKRGSYKQTEKNKNRCKKSILIKDDVIIKQFESLTEVSEYFNIKLSTASVWLKQDKIINNMILKTK